jgi:ABC-2 type transport system permease protein
MLRNLIAADVLALRKRPSTWTLLGVWITMTLLFGYVLPYVSYSGGETSFGGDGALPREAVLLSLLPDRLVSTSTQGMPVFGGAIALIFGALLVGSPYGWGVVKTAYTQRAGRLRHLTASVSVVAAAMLAAVLITVVAGTLASLAIASAEGQSLALPPLADWARGIGAGWLVMTMWSAAGVVLATLTRGTALSVGLGLVWALVVENLVRGIAGSISWLDALRDWLPGVNAGSLMAALLPDSALVDTPGIAAVVSGSRATAVLLSYVVLFVAAAAVLVRRRDVA